MFLWPEYGNAGIVYVCSSGLNMHQRLLLGLAGQVFSMKVQTIILAILPWLSCQVVALITKHCNVAEEPTFGELFQLVSPVAVPNIDLSASASKFDSILLRAGGSVMRHLFNNLYNMKLPLGYLITDGVFEIESSKTEANIENYDTVLLKHKPLIQQVRCIVQ